MAKYEVVFAAGDDPALEEAAKQARAHFKFFWRELSWEYRRIIPAFSLTAVKAAFADEGAPERAEHMWVTDLVFDGELLSGTLLNQPRQLTSLQEGASVRLALGQLEDWMYVLRDQVHGAWSVQALRAKMEAPERAQHDDAWGLDFGDPASVRLAKHDLEGAEHPMSENMAVKLGEAIDQDRRGFLENADADGFTTLHTMALAGSQACVRVLLEKGADRSGRTKSGKTALDLATLMGWPNVIALLR